MKGLKGKRALVTGATGLIGSALTRRLVQEGARVVVCSRDYEKAKAWCEHHRDLSENVVPLELALSDRASIDKAFEWLERNGEMPTILVANASLREGLDTPLDSLSHEDFTNLFNVDVAGHFLCAARMVERHPETSRVAIVWISSVYGMAGTDQSIYPDGNIGTPPQYPAVKSAANGLTRYMAALWGGRGVRVNAVVAGGVINPERQTESFVRNYASKTMLGRMADADEIASAAIFLASEDASYITGQCVAVDGGYLAW